MAKDKRVDKSLPENAPAEIALALTELGDALASLRAKVYAVTQARIASAAKRLRFLLRVEGEEERTEGGVPK